jgi:hypothetical protein
LYRFLCMPAAGACTAFYVWYAKNCRCSTMMYYSFVAFM